MSDDNLNLAFDTYEPINIDDGHIISSPGDENMDSFALQTIYKEVYSEENLWSLRSLLVFRNGKLVSETYLKDKQDIVNRHLVWSCTKQVMGVLTGIAIDNGMILSIDDPISDYLDKELTDQKNKGSVTIKNLLTMQSGIDYVNTGDEGQTDKLLRNIPDNSIEFILKRPVTSPPGTKFHYNDGNPHLISAIIQKTCGKPTDEWADEVLFSKIEMSNYNWARYKDGITLGGFGIETTPRELAKVALCVADSGRWKGQQVVSSEWIKAMTSSQVKIKDFDYSFGYFWWIDSERDVYFMWGVGGQFAFIVPKKNLVIVMTSFPNTKGDYEIQADEALPVVDRIIGATN